MTGKTKYILALCEVIALLFGLIPNNVEAAKTDIPIPIVMATDNNYAMPTMVSITSAAENANKDTKLEFYILTTPDFSKDNTSNFEKLAERFSNCSIKIINMGDTFKDVYKSVWGIATYYRLKVTSILKDKDKCIYLDGDTLVLKDLTDMYNTDIGDNYVAGSPDGQRIWRQHTAERIGIPDADYYICAGVLLWNLKKAREDNLEQRFDKFLEEVIGKGPNENILYPDQDAINVVCYGKITDRSFKYGAIDWILSCPSYDGTFLEKLLPKEEWEEAAKDPVILHFIEKKPWKFRNVRFRPLWKKYQMHMNSMLKQ